MSAEELDKYKRFFDDQASNENTKRKESRDTGRSKTKSQKDGKSSRKRNATVDARNEKTLDSAGARLLDNFVGETLSDQHKISLMEDSRIFEEECDDMNCT